MMSDKVIAIDALRTPAGTLGGALKAMTAPQLGSVVIGALFKNNQLNPDRIDQVIMGNALPAGIGPCPARQAALKAGLSNATLCTTINNGMASGMMAVTLAMQLIETNQADIIIAGGMESMSRVPHYLRDLRTGLDLGHSSLLDGIVADNLQDTTGKHQQGELAERFAADSGISRHEQDIYTMESHRRFETARKKNCFARETVRLKYRNKKGEAHLISKDEAAGMPAMEILFRYPPAYSEEGSVTVANSAPHADGAAALLLMNREKAVELGFKASTRLISKAVTAHTPARDAAAAAEAMNLALQHADKAVSDMDLLEINETFAVSALACSKGLGSDNRLLNIHGGALSLGNPAGCSGARILVTLIHALRHHGKQWGCAGISDGTGGACSVVVHQS